MQEIKLYLVLEFSVDCSPQHEEKNGTIIYNLLSLNDAKRLNIFPEKFNLEKRGTVNHLIPDRHALGGGWRQEGTGDFIIVRHWSTSTTELEPRRLAPELGRKMDPLENPAKEGNSRRNPPEGDLHPRAQTWGCRGRPRTSSRPRLSTPAEQRRSRGQDAVEELPVLWKCKEESATRAPDR